MRLAVSLRLRHAEIPTDVLPRASALLLAEYDDGSLLEKCRSSDEGLIIPIDPIPVQFLEILKDRVDVVEGVGAFRMSRDLDPLPCRQVGIELTLGGIDFLFDIGNFIGDVQQLSLRGLLDLGELLFEVTKGFLEIQGE